jgi:hypothetical protein
MLEHALYGVGAQGCRGSDRVVRSIARNGTCAIDVLCTRNVKTYRLYMSETMSISASAAAIFCSDESWGRPPKRKDMFVCVVLVRGSKVCRLGGDGEDTRDEWWRCGVV